MNRKKNTPILIFLVFILKFNPFYGQVVYSDINENIGVPNNQISVYQDKTNNLTITEISKSQEFKLINSSSTVPNFGITSSSIWLRVSVKNNTDLRILLLKVSQPIIDEIEFYIQDSLSGIFNSVKSGEYLPFGNRKYKTPEYIFDLNIPRGKLKTFYLKVRCKENMQIPMSIGSYVSTFNSLILSNLASGIYMGIMLVMLLYNLFIYGIFRDKSYVLYSLYILLILLTQTSLQGYTFQFLWPKYPSFSIYSQFFFPSLVGLIALEFFKEFLRIKERMPKTYKISFIFLVPYIFAPILSLFGFYSVSFAIIEGTASTVSIFMLVVAYLIYHKGFSEARFFLLGWSIFLIGICVYVLKDFEVLPYNNFTRYTMHFGSAIEVILLSFALAERINILKKEKEESQAEALLVSQQNQKLITEQNIVLEQKVHERTLELEETNEELNVTLSYLKDTQAQLVDAEKMASLGQLTAGIAHEINNPINFVSANLTPLKMDIKEILELVKKYDEIKSSEDLESKIKNIDDYKKEIDLDYLTKEIDTLLAGIEDGARRTAEIVLGLKIFSRLDESDIKKANINDGIESTLVILRSSVPDNVEIKLNLGAIPLIDCFPGKLNQVFMNLFTNALYAMKQKSSADKNTLTINSFEKNDKVYVTIEDTGVGMSKKIKEKIFEPFFTTKDVGEGTGLGMSIVFKIVESHQSKLEIESEEGKGSKVTLILNKKLN